jgi:hypothetical protein
MAKGRSVDPQESITPPRYPEIPPPQQPSGDYSYTVELVARIENQLGKLTKAVEQLEERSRERDRKFEEIGKELHLVSQDVNSAKVVAKVMGGVIAFMGFLVTVTIAVIGYIAIPVLFKLLDVGSEILKKTH